MNENVFIHSLPEDAITEQPHRYEGLVTDVDRGRKVLEGRLDDGAAEVQGWVGRAPCCPSEAICADNLGFFQPGRAPIRTSCAPRMKARIARLPLGCSRTECKCKRLRF